MGRGCRAGFRTFLYFLVLALSNVSIFSFLSFLVSVLFLVWLGG